MRLRGGYRIMSGEPKAKHTVSNVMIVIGIIFLLIFGIYRGLHYPWMMLFSRWGWVELSQELPDPPPLPESVLLPMDSMTAADETEAMPDQPGMFSTRQSIQVTPLGIIKIPRIQVSENIVEGSKEELLYGVGHVRGTAMPGESGNCVLAGHRNNVFMQPFRYMDRMEIGDIAYIVTNDATYSYEAFKIFEINPDDAWILQPQEEEEYLLTLLTCTPVMTNARRLIIWCRLVEIQPKTEGFIQNSN